MTTQFRVVSNGRFYVWPDGRVVVRLPCPPISKPGIAVNERSWTVERIGERVR